MHLDNTVQYFATRFAASCRELQASSLCSREFRNRAKLFAMQLRRFD
jgi:hypothetical protein